MPIIFGILILAFLPLLLFFAPVLLYVAPVLIVWACCLHFLHSWQEHHHHQHVRHPLHH